MIMQIPLRVEGLDPDSQAYLEMDSELEDDLIWTWNCGVLTATVLVEEGDPVEFALDAARRVRKLVPGAVISGAYDELVSISDIAARVGVAAEGVRLWADGKRRATTGNSFPRVEQAITQGRNTTRLYAWRNVVRWVRAASMRLDPDEGVTYLSDEQFAELNAQLHREQADSRVAETELLPKRKVAPIETRTPKAIYAAEADVGLPSAEKIFISYAEKAQTYA